MRTLYGPSGTMRVTYLDGENTIEVVCRSNVASDEIMKELVRIGKRKGLHSPSGSPITEVICEWSWTHSHDPDFHPQWKLQVS